MALADLTVEAMLMISRGWLDVNGARGMLESIPTAAAMLPRLARVHSALEGVRSGNSEGGQRLLELVSEATETDRLHDRKVRGLYHLLTALSELTEEPMGAARYLDLRDALLPHGLETADLSYHDEADSALYAEQRLTPQQRDMLKRIPLPWGGIAMNEVDAWRETGRRLVQIEHHWATLKRKATGDGGSSDLIHARHAWVKVVRTLRQVLELDESPQHIVDSILRPLMEAEALASSVANASREVEALHRSVDEGLIFASEKDLSVPWVADEELTSIEMLYNEPPVSDITYGLDVSLPVGEMDDERERSSD